MSEQTNKPNKTSYIYKYVRILKLYVFHSKVIIDYFECDIYYIYICFIYMHVYVTYEQVYNFKFLATLYIRYKDLIRICFNC